MNEKSRRKAATSLRGRGFLNRLARDSRGNTLAVVGAALVPLAAMIGSGVDMSRAYMAKTRLQNACDAAALAGRRVMQEDQMTDAVRAEAVRFFNFNFNQGQYGTAAFTPTVTRPETGKVRVSASTTIPTTVMQMFGFTTLPLSVTCDASLNFVNTDVMLVLDTTTSMLCRPEDTATNCTTYGRDDPQTRIVALEDAVMALYDELAPIQTQLEANGMRLRYGIVPYSSSVNVGGILRTANSNWLVDSHDYQSRVANYTTRVNVDTPITAPQAGLLVNPGVQRFQVGGVDRQISNTNCGNFGSNTTFSQSGTSPVGGSYTALGPNGDNDIYVPEGSSTAQANAPAAPTGYTRYQFSRNTASWSGGAANRVCDRNVTITRRTYRYKFTSWTYRQVNYDTSQYKTGQTMTIAGNITTSNSGSVASSGTYTLRELPALVSNVTTSPASGTLPTITTTAWNGCIEERGTTDAITPTYGYVIPPAAYDLNINLVPTGDNATRWRPMFPEIAHSRTAGSTTATSGSAASASCPSPAERLRAWTREDMRNYVDDLNTSMYTYHDIGMIWGARLLSNQGLFAADNPDTFNGMPVSRHIIFMTDGVMQPACNNYASWGIEQNDSRVTASSCGDPDQANRHVQRMKMVCNASKSMGFSVWVIAFGSTLQPHLLECASNANQASRAANRDELIARFRQIGSNIGALRLTQ